MFEGAKFVTEHHDLHIAVALKWTHVITISSVERNCANNSAELAAYACYAHNSWQDPTIVWTVNA